MCYDVRYLTKKLADYEQRYGDLADLTEIARKIDPSYQPHPKQFFHVNAFSHEALPVITSAGAAVSFYDWGLIPHWVRSTSQAVEIQQKTLNARGEELFEKPSFRDPIKSQRCIIMLDGFYEHHHKSGRSFPYHIQMKDHAPMSVAGLWEEWHDDQHDLLRQTCTIVTTAGNELMADIHNHPKLKGPRMPMLLTEQNENEWISGKAFSKDDMKLFLEPVQSALLEAYPVQQIRGKKGVGNSERAIAPFQYPELQKGLFDM